jgi:hypothetical protein
MGDMMRAGISRVVVEIIILVIAVALALLIFSPISGYIFGSLGRTSTVGGAANIQVLSANFSADGALLTVYVKNLGPGTIPGGGWQVFVDGIKWSSGASQETLAKDQVLSLTVTGTAADTTKQHSITIYGPAGVQAQYLYYPPS